MAVEVDENTMGDIARAMLDMEGEKNGDDECFRSLFGAPLLVIAKLWNAIVRQSVDENAPLRNNAHPDY